MLWPPDARSRLIRKYPDVGKGWGQEEKGMTEDEVVGWHHRYNGHDFEQTPEDGEGQGSLTCCNPWGYKESDMTQQLNNNKIQENKRGSLLVLLFNEAKIIFKGNTALNFLCVLFLFFKFYWSLDDLQFCISFRSKVTQLYIYIYPLFFRFFSHIGHYRVLSIVPCAIQ